MAMNTLVLDGNAIKVVDSATRSGCYVANVEIVESHHLATETKRELLRAALSQMPSRQVEAIAGVGQKALRPDVKSGTKVVWIDYMGSVCRGVAIRTFTDGGVRRVEIVGTRDGYETEFRASPPLERVGYADRRENPEFRGVVGVEAEVVQA